MESFRAYLNRNKKDISSQFRTFHLNLIKFVRRLTRLLPGLATVVAWDGCDHIGPAFEGDMLEFRHTLKERVPTGGGHLMRFEVIGTGVYPDGSTKDLLRWTPVVWAP